MAKVVLYTTPFCPYCRMALQLFERKGVAYENIDVTGDREKRRWLLETTGQHTVPQVFVGGTSLGGYTDVAALESQGALDPLLNA